MTRTEQQMKSALDKAQRDGVVFEKQTIRKAGPTWIIVDANDQVKFAFRYSAGVQMWLKRCYATGHQITPTVSECYVRSQPPIKPGVQGSPRAALPAQVPHKATQFNPDVAITLGQDTLKAYKTLQEVRYERCDPTHFIEWEKLEIEKRTEYEKAVRIELNYYRKVHGLTGGGL